MDQFDSFVDLAMEHIDALVSQARREVRAAATQPSSLLLGSNTVAHQGFLEGEGALAYLAAIGNAVNGDQILKAAVVAGLGLFSFFQTYCDRLGEQVRAAGLMVSMQGEAELMPGPPAQVKEAGGLLVIGAAFMPSERVAMQLRGRAGRQVRPLPGLSVFAQTPLLRGRCGLIGRPRRECPHGEFHGHLHSHHSQNIPRRSDGRDGENNIQCRVGAWTGFHSGTSAPCCCC